MRGIVEIPSKVKAFKTENPGEGHSPGLLGLDVA